MTRVISMYPGKHKKELKTGESTLSSKNAHKRQIPSKGSFIKRIIKMLLSFGYRTWLKPAEVQKMLGISPEGLDKLRNDGLLPFCKIGNEIYYDPRDVDAALKERKNAQNVGGTHFTRKPK